MMIDNSESITAKEARGNGYDEFWRTKKRYVVCKGSRASKKSKTTALWHIVNIMGNPGANALVCLLYTSPSPRDGATSRMPSSA